MSKRRVAQAALAAAGAVFAFGVAADSAAQRRRTQSDVLALRPGAYWVYEGTVRAAKPGTAEVLEKTVQWKMEVVEAIERQSLAAFVIKGFPADLAWYAEGKEQGDYLLLRVQGDRYYLVRDHRVEEVLRRLRDPSDPLIGLVREEELYLQLPADAGAVFGATEQITREDRLYCWVYSESREVSLDHVRELARRGRDRRKKRTAHEQEYRSLADVTIVEWVATLGITRYRYHHNGTVSDVDVRLVEYSPGRAAAQGPGK
jgi:hypothetical protein